MTIEKNIAPEKITLTTWLGHEIDLLTGPRHNQIQIEDIAHHLAMQCRFAGAVDRFYSVAEHSIYVSLYAPSIYAIYYLLHDAAEYLLQDITAPNKKLIWGIDYKNNTDYKKILKRIEKPLFEKFGVSFFLLHRELSLLTF